MKGTDRGVESVELAVADEGETTPDHHEALIAAPYEPKALETPQGPGDARLRAADGPQANRGSQMLQAGGVARVAGGVAHEPPPHEETGRSQHGQPYRFDVRVVGPEPPMGQPGPAGERHDPDWRRGAHAAAAASACSARRRRYWRVRRCSPRLSARSAKRTPAMREAAMSSASSAVMTPSATASVITSASSPAGGGVGGTPGWGLGG